MREYSYRPLSAAPRLMLPAFEGMTFPAYRELMSGTSEDAGIAGICAWHDLHPAGLGLARLAGKDAEILSVFAARDFRHEGIGTALLTELEENLRARGAARARLSYNTASPCASYLERILDKLDWAKPAPSMLLAQAGDEIMQAPWFGARRFPSGFEIFPWSALTEGERTAMEESQAASPWAPDNLWPFQYEHDLEPSNSLGLRRKGEVVGWIITNRIAEKTVRYTSAFIREEYRRPGRTFILISEAVRRQAQTLGNDSLGTFGVWMEQGAMVRLMERKLVPWLRSAIQTRASSKVLLKE